MKHLFTFLLLLFIGASLADPYGGDTLEFSGLFRKYRDKGSDLLIQLQFGDTCAQVKNCVNKLLIPDDTDPGNMAVGNLFEAMEEILALEDTLVNRLYVNDTISNSVECRTDTNLYILDCVVLPFNNSMNSAFYWSYGGYQPGDTTTGVLYYGNQTIINASIADTGAIRVFPKDYMNTSLLFVNCDNKESMGFKGMAYSYIENFVAPSRQKAIPLWIWNAVWPPWTADAEFKYDYGYIEGEMDLDALFGAFPFLEPYSEIDYLFAVE